LASFKPGGDFADDLDDAILLARGLQDHVERVFSRRRQRDRRRSAQGGGGHAELGLEGFTNSFNSSTLICSIAAMNSSFVK